MRLLNFQVKIGLTLSFIFVFPIILFFSIDVFFRPPVADQTLENILNDFKNEAFTNSKGKPYIDNPKFGSLIKEIAPIASKLGPIGSNSASPLPSIPETMDPSLSERLDSLSKYVEKAEGYVGYHLPMDEPDSYLSGYGYSPKMATFPELRSIIKCYLIRARWREQQGDIHGAFKDFLTAQLIAKHSNGLTLLDQMIVAANVQEIFDPLIEFLRKHGQKLTESELIQLMEALQDYDSVMEGVEFETYWRLLTYWKMASEWPRSYTSWPMKWDPQIFTSIETSWFEKTLLSFLPKNYFKYLIYIRFEGSGLFRESNKLSFNDKEIETLKQSLATNLKIAPSSNFYKEKKSFRIIQFLMNSTDVNIFKGHSLAHFIYKLSGLNEIIGSLEGWHWEAFLTREKIRDTRLKQLQAMAAIYLYKMHMGRFPKSLDELIPKYLKELPLNYTTEKPIQLTYLADGDTRKPYFIYEPGNADASTSSVIDIDGNAYKTVRIGNQVWMAENLRTTKYNDGTPIPLVTDSAAWKALATPGYCYYDNTTNADNIKKFGALYNWYVVNTKKLAPKGWHVPTDAEWTILENYLIANGYNWDGTTEGNKIAKSMAAKTDWITTTFLGAIGNDLSENNKSGFSALPGGCRGKDGSGNFFIIGDFGYWWSATGPAASHAFSRYLRFISDHLGRNILLKSYGFSVRLLRDE